MPRSHQPVRRGRFLKNGSRQFRNAALSGAAFFVGLRRAERFSEIPDTCLQGSPVMRQVHAQAGVRRVFRARSGWRGPDSAAQLSFAFKVARSSERPRDSCSAACYLGALVSGANSFLKQIDDQGVHLRSRFLHENRANIRKFPLSGPQKERSAERIATFQRISRDEKGSQQNNGDCECGSFTPKRPPDTPSPFPVILPPCFQTPGHRSQSPNRSGRRARNPRKVGQRT